MTTETKKIILLVRGIEIRFCGKTEAWSQCAGDSVKEVQETAHRDSVNIVPITRLLPQHYIYCVLKTNDALCLRSEEAQDLGIVCLEN